MNKSSPNWMVRLVPFVAVATLSCNNGPEFAGQSLEARPPAVLADQKFKTAVYGENTLRFNAPFGLVEQTLTMAEKPPVIDTLTQMVRPIEVETATQGFSGDRKEEEFEVSKASPVDLLIVVDNSTSMETEQKNLAANMKSLTKFLDRTDWRIGVITTDDSCLRGGKVIAKGDGDAEQRFEEAIEAGTTGSGQEEGLLMSHRALQGKCKENGTEITKKWLRDDSAIAVLYVSDENSYCPRGNCRSDGRDPADVAKLLTSIRKKEDVRAYAMTFDPNDAKCVADTNPRQESAGARYLQLIAGEKYSIGGVAGLVCGNEQDYAKVLEQISLDVSRILKKEFQLEFPPDMSSVQITIDGVALENTDYELVDNVLKLGELQGDVMKMKVTYAYGSTPMFDTFPLTGAVAAGTLEVFVDGKLVADDKRNFDSSSGAVFFNEMPTDNAKIMFKYRRNDELPVHFDFAGRSMLDDKPMSVNVAGQRADFQFDQGSSVLTLDEAPVDGAPIEVAYRGLDARIESYASTISTEDYLVAIDVRDTETGDNLSTKLSNGWLSFDPQEVWTGRQVTVTYNYGTEDNRLNYELPAAPLPGSLEVWATNENEDCIRNAAVEGRRLTFVCDGDELDEVQVAYRYLAQHLTDFEVAGDWPLSGARFKVFIDGQAFDGFSRDLRQISIPKATLRQDSEVRIIVSEPIR